MNGPNDDKWSSMIIRTGGICNLVENILQGSDLPLSAQGRYEDITMDSTKKRSVKLQL